jgi:glutamate N-acetyltransferase/amino-acid N-acetyltransferase
MQRDRLRVPGFRTSGVRAGIKKRGLDLALLVADAPAAVAGVFTRSSVVGAPVELNRRRVRSGYARGVVVNSGCSNVAMGERGRRDAAEMARRAALAVGAGPDQMLVASTGVIGQPLPMAKIGRGIAVAAASLSEFGLARAAEAIRTTDTFAKLAQSTFRLGGRRIRVAGIAKGSGMIEPNMGTLLAFLLTDAAASPVYLRGALRRAADASFNRVTVDGETSTSDTMLLFASGVSGAPVLRSAQTREARAFEAALAEVAVSLARDVARDGEGATRLVTVRVREARSPAEAEHAARRIANSLLVKTALFGGDANWGRILQTVGAGRIRLALPRTQVKLAGVVVFRQGASTGPAARARAARALRAREIEVEIRLGAGRAAAQVWTCDLSYDYVRINAEYTT